jgi:hypothetical protein
MFTYTDFTIGFNNNNTFIVLMCLATAEMPVEGKHWGMKQERWNRHKGKYTIHNTRKK